MPLLTAEIDPCTSRIPVTRIIAKLTCLVWFCKITLAKLVSVAPVSWKST
jgi:hypothetical protein